MICTSKIVKLEMIYIAICSCVLCFVQTQEMHLQCNKDNKFKIIQFTDCHFGENTVHDKQSKQSFKDLLNYESPDLIAISGDFVSGYAWNGEKDWFRNVFNNGMEPILSSNIPWSYILGNHDCEADWNRTQVISYAQQLPQSYTRLSQSSINGASNFVISVMDGIETNVAVANIWFLDSMQRNCYGVHGWGCVSFTTIDWYRRTSIALEEKYGRKVPGIMYIHIPLPELLSAYNEATEIIGTMKENDICCSALNTGLFAMLQSRKDVIQVWHGHDHDNDFYLEYNSIVIGYGRKTTFGSYGRIPRGARVIQFDCDFNRDIHNISGNTPLKWKTWIREISGNVDIQEIVQKDVELKTRTKCCAPYENKKCDIRKTEKIFNFKECKVPV